MSHNKNSLKICRYIHMILHFNRIVYGITYKQPTLQIDVTGEDTEVLKHRTGFAAASIAE
jgi:hypothetical protein